MFDTNEDFDIDEDFLKSEGSTLNQIISSTPLSNSVNSTFNSRKVASPVKNAGQFNSAKSNNKISIFESDELLNENFLDTEFMIEDELEKKIQKQFNVNGTKRPFSEILKNENKKMCINNSESNKVTIEQEKHVNKILNIVKNAPASQNRLTPEKNLDQNIFKIIPKENKTFNSFNETVQPSNTVIRKRKFPGPAGLLPEINSIDEIPEIKLNNLENAPTENPLPSVTICSQDTVTKFHQSPWKRMLQDYDVNHENQIPLPQQYTIAWLKNIANINRLNQRKAPFLAAIVDAINSISDDCVVKLKDKTGEIDGVIDTETWEKLSPILMIGSVIVLHQVGVLTFSVKKHYLNITSNNIMVVYSPSETNDDVKVTKGSHYLNYSELYESILRQQQLNRISSINKSNNTNLLPCLKAIETKPNIYSNSIAHSSNSNFIDTSLPSTSRNLNLIAANKTMSGSSSKPTINNPNFNLTDNRNMFGTSPKSTVNNKNKPKFNFMKEKLNQFAYKPRHKTEETNLDANNSNATNNSEDIESIISSTFAGIDADSFFDDF